MSIPGATVTAKQGEKTISTITDQGGVYRFTGLADGAWTVTVKMVGFETITRDVTLPSSAEGVWELTLLPIEKIVGALPAPRAAPDEPAAASSASQPRSGQKPATNAAATPQTGFQRAGVNQVSTPPPPAAADDAPVDPTGIGSAAGLLINGSVNNGAASPFAQARAFGSNRPNQRSLYTYSAGLQMGNSEWDARPYSFGGADTRRPSYTDAQFQGTFQGPVKVPGLRNRVNFFVSYQGTSDHNAQTQSSNVPTELERLGDFSNSVNAQGLPIQVHDPTTGLPFAGNTLGPGRISPQAAALLTYYPLPNTDGRFNYQTPILNSSRSDSASTRLAYSLNNRNQLQGTVGYQKTRGDSTTLFGFEDTRDGSGIDAQVNWSFRISQFLNMRTRYQFTGSKSTSLPYFAGRTNVSAEAGIVGNDQDPLNWGPPQLQFASDIAGLSDGRYSRARTATHVVGSEIQSFRGRHTVTTGGEYRRIANDIFSQQDPRGTFKFTGARSGSDFADFLLGLPQTTSIAYGNADKFFRSNSYAAYVTDDWRLSPSFTLMLGVRWEYESPVSERLGRLVNLDIDSDFTEIDPVLASDATGTVTGASYPQSLVRPDKGGFQPRLGLAWRPVPGSSLVVRAGYGVYRNTNVYQSIATQLAQQPPLSTAFEIGNTAQHPLTLADGLLVGQMLGAANTLNTFAVDPELRVGYRTELAGIAAARSADVADGECHVSRVEGQQPDAGVRAEHLSDRCGQSVPRLPDRLPLSGVGRAFDSQRRTAAAPPAFAQRVHLVSPVHDRIGEGQRRVIQRRKHRRAGAGAELARPRGGIRALQLRPAPPGGRHVRIHHGRRRPGRHAPRRLEGPPVQGLDVRQPGDDRQWTAADADLFLASRSDRHHRRVAAEPDRHVARADRRRHVRESCGVRGAGRRRMGHRIA